METELVVSSVKDKDWVMEQLMAYNRQVLGISKEDYLIPLNFNIRNSNDKIVAGINASMFGKGSVYVGILWVDNKHQNKGYGSLLLKKVEDEARKNGAVMAHLDTFDFQARGFYVKHGYELFGAIGDSPTPGRMRFYLKKDL